LCSYVLLRVSSRWAFCTCFCQFSELAVIIGKPGRGIQKEDALDHIFGWVHCWSSLMQNIVSEDTYNIRLFVNKVFGTGDHLNVCFPRTVYQCGSGSVNFDNVQLKEVRTDLGQVYHPEWCNCKRGAKASPAGRWILSFSLVLHQPILVTVCA